MPHDVFISYSSKDHDVAEKVCWYLEQHGIQCWIAPRDIVPGQNYAAAIVDGISSAKVFLLIFSSHANASNQVERELERAVAKKLTVIPFRIEDVKPAREFEYWISTPHWLDAYPLPLEPHLMKLTASVQRIMGRGPMPASRGATAAPPPAEAARVVAPVPTAAPMESNRLSQKIAIASGAATFALAGVVVASIYLQKSEKNYEPVPATTPIPVPVEDPGLTQVVALLKASEGEIGKWTAGARGKLGAEQTSRQLDVLRKSRQKIQDLFEGEALVKKFHLETRATQLLEHYDKGIADLNVQWQTAQLNQGLSQLDGAIGDSARFAGVLTQLAERFPNAGPAGELKSVAAEEPEWAGVERWNGLLSQKSFADRALTPAVAAKLVADAATLPRISPLVEYYLAKEPFLSAIASRVDFSGTPVTGGLRNYLSNRSMNDFYVIELNDGTRYYLNDDPDELVARSDGAVKVEYIVNARRETKHVWESPKDIRYRGRAPHCELANEVLQGLDDPQLLTTEWVPVFCRTLERIADDKASDPIARALIFEQTLAAAVLGSEEIRRAFQKQTASLAERRIDASVAWFNPSDSRALAERRKAEELFRTLPSVSIAAREANALADKWRQGSPPNFAWTGWLRRDNEQRWVLAGSQAVGPGTMKYVVTKSASDQRAALREIGELAGSPTNSKTGQELLRAGRPVFIQRESP